MSNDLNLNYNLPQLFNNLSTSFYNPIIKYFNNNIETNIKIFKGILKKLNNDELRKLINPKKQDNYINNLNSINKLDYIQFIWYIK